MLLNKMFSRYFILLLTAIGCRGQTNYKVGTASNTKDALIINCFVTRPVKNDSKADTLRDFKFTRDSLDSFLADIISLKRPVVYDSAMDYMTSFDYQKIISINFCCFKKLPNPDSCGLLNIYFNSRFATWVKKRSAVQFLQSYKKNIYNFGSTIVYEYQFNNVAEIEPHFMYILLKEQTESEGHYGRDYLGFVICSDGLDWKDFHDKGFSIPLFKKMIRRSKEIYIPLYYDGERFIPAGHFKSGNWQE